MKNKNQLIDILQQTRDFLSNYDNISWHGLSPAEGAMDLEIQLDYLRNNEPWNKKYIAELFETEGLIHECAKVNGWNEKYQQLLNDLRPFL